NEHLVEDAKASVLPANYTQEK
ncbi:MAG: hypothetical protein Greene101449_1301, partial [Candidatus Peregrinibacteria bacterium Greene1014_49]